MKIAVTDRDRQEWDAISALLEDYLNQQLSQPDEAIAASPQERQDDLRKNAATIQAVRDIILTQLRYSGKTPHWTKISGNRNALIFLEIHRNSPK